MIENRIVEKWEMKEQWFIHGPRDFFHIADVKVLTKGEPNAIRILFIGCQIDVSFPDKEKRDELFGWLVERRVSYADACRKKEAISEKIQLSQLEIQNQMAGKFINGPI